MHRYVGCVGGLDESMAANLRLHRVSPHTDLLGKPNLARSELNESIKRFISWRLLILFSSILLNAILLIPY